MKLNHPIRAITLDDPAYPALLKEISDPPEILYVRGVLPPLGMPLVAIVGTRACTPYGRQVTEEFSRMLAEQGVGIVSGLALGIDSLAHTAALAAGGYTMAVLGVGIDPDTIYPAVHRGLSERILEAGGALVSEYPPGFQATNYSFQARNRIIAGLSLATLVTEAPQKSGALITAKHAVGYNRELFVVPHNITNPQGEGNNGFLKLGAHPALNYLDILTELRLTPRASSAVDATELDPSAQTIFNLLGRQPLYIDTIIKTSQMPSAAVTGILTILELKKLVKNMGGMRYIKT